MTYRFLWVNVGHISQRRVVQTFCHHANLLGLICQVLLIGLALVWASVALADAVNKSPYPWASFQKPFSPQSPWNSRPVKPVLGDFQIPKASYFPIVAGNEWSTGAFLASQGDPKVEVFPLVGKAGVYDADAEVMRPSVAIPRWPALAHGAAGGDGHAEVVDPVLGVIHSFWQLRSVAGVWRAARYAWSPLAGRGWGDPAHYAQGARASGVPTIGGLIRTHEVDDGDEIFRHALAMSLTFNALNAKPAYVFPATLADTIAPTPNTGEIPEGALMMLPPDFDTQPIRNPQLRKVAETLKVYGAYVVDRNFGTPFFIYAEIGSAVHLHPKGRWDSAVGIQLDRMRMALRQVVAADSWIDGDGKPVEFDRQLNLLSMRGPWRLDAGGVAGRFDSWQQAVVFEPQSERVVQTNASGRNLNKTDWAIPVANQRFRLTASGTGGGKLRLKLHAADREVLFDSGDLDSGSSIDFDWPAGQTRSTLTVTSGLGARPSSVGGMLVALPPPVSQVKP